MQMSVLTVKPNNKPKTQLCLQTLCTIGITKHMLFCDTSQKQPAHISDPPPQQGPRVCYHTRNTASIIQSEAHETNPVQTEPAQKCGVWYLKCAWSRKLFPSKIKGITFFFKPLQTLFLISHHHITQTKNPPFPSRASSELCLYSLALVATDHFYFRNKKRFNNKNCTNLLEVWL